MRCQACKKRAANPDIEATNEDGDNVPLCNACARLWLSEYLEDNDVVGDA